VKRTLVSVLVTIAAWSASGQTRRPSFEVASVKRDTADGFPDFTPRRSGDRVTMHSIRLASVVIYAYHLANGRATTSYQLAGNLQLPEGWEVYDIDAIAPGSPSDDDLRLMFQTLLEDRFKLRVHWETKELPIYDLLIGKNGPKLKPTVQGRKAVPENRPTETEPGVSHLGGRGVSIEQLISALSGRLDMPVRNLTGLTGGAFDFNVAFARDGNLSIATSAPDLVTAIDEELGLKLKRTRGPVEVLVVDHVEKPSGN
jgi:uncharacterized protein (TIGR03435 family)